MLFSEKSVVIPAAFNNDDSKTPVIPNVQQEPIHPWALTDDVHLQSHESYLVGRVVTLIVLLLKINCMPSPIIIVAKNVLLVEMLLSLMKMFVSSITDCLSKNV